MKKKFINGFLMVAMLFATTSSFVSCKDNVDDDLSDVYNNLGKKSSELQDKINSVQNDLQKQIDNIKPVIYEYGDTIIQNITENITQIIEFNVDSICNDYNTKIENINQDLEIINQQITNQTLAIDSINNALNYIDNRINNVGDSVNILWARVDSIVGILDALVDGDLITSVRVETTRNDVLGIINTPIAKVNALAAYYGTNDSGIEEFPYSGYDFNVGGNRFAEWLEDYELPDAGFVKLDESDYITDAYANAGQIYFTVNSTNYKNFDISKITKIQIENSAGEVAPIQLNVRKSTARINWDFGRAFLEETGVDQLLLFVKSLINSAPIYESNDEDDDVILHMLSRFSFQYEQHSTSKGTKIELIFDELEESPKVSFELDRTEDYYTDALNEISNFDTYNNVLNLISENFNNTDPEATGNIHINIYGK